MRFKLRDHTAKDLETLHEIDQACYPRGIAYSRRMLQWYLNQPGTHCLVAEAAQTREHSILGFIVGQASGEAGYIITIDVLAAHRRTGVGTALLRESERRMAKAGVHYIELQTATNNEAGIAFWQRHGYRSCGVIRGYYLGRIDAYEMLKELHQPGRPATA